MIIPARYLGVFRPTEGRVAGALWWAIKLPKTKGRIAMPGGMSHSVRPTIQRVAATLEVIDSLTTTEG
jgi:hypothetical protein